MAASGIEASGRRVLRRAASAALYLRFHSGDDYRYFTFPAEQYEEFLAAESQGRYFLAHIRNQFPYERIPRR